MEIRQITQDKKRYLDLLYLADEQESMIDRYLDRGTLFALYEENRLKTVAVVTRESEDICEIKNIATYPAEQRKGYGKYMVSYLFEYYKSHYTTMLVGTGDFPATILFYENCGFVVSHRVENFFIDNYDHPIYEEGEQLIDMVYLKKILR